MRLKILLLTLILTAAAVPAFSQVILYAEANQHGASQGMGRGKNSLNAELQGHSASLSVGEGFVAKVCGAPAPHSPIGAPDFCVTFPEGKYNFNRLKNQVKSVEAERPQNPDFRDNAHSPTYIFTGPGHTGNKLTLTYGDEQSLSIPVVPGPLDGNPAPLWSGTITSIASEMTVMLCMRPTSRHAPTPNCVILPPGIRDVPAEYNNRAFYINVIPEVADVH